MIAPAYSADDEIVVLHEVSWEEYEAILDAIGEYHLRHCYLRGDFECRRLLCGVAWEDYQKLLSAIGERSLPHTYYHGWLEMMSPLRQHDSAGRFLVQLLTMMCFDLKIQLDAIGSTTIGSRTGGAGFQPDEAFYVQNASRVRHRSVFEPGVDPPPDLVVEVDVTRKSLGRMPVFAAAGVPEVWRIVKDELLFYRPVNAETYRPIQVSLAFPFLRPADFDSYLPMRFTTDHNEVFARFVENARKRYRALKKASPVRRTKKPTSRCKDS